jgi:hypothetical protein
MQGALTRCGVAELDEEGFPVGHTCISDRALVVREHLIFALQLAPLPQAFAELEIRNGGDLRDALDLIDVGSERR